MSKGYRHAAELREKRHKLDTREGRFSLSFYTYITPELRWYVSERGCYDKDDMLDIRFAEALGASYLLFEQQDRFNFWLNLALARIDAYYEQQVTDHFWAIEAGFDTAYIISQEKGITFTTKFRITPNLENYNDYLWYADSGLTFNLTDSLDLRISLEMDFDSEPFANTVG